MPHNYEEKQTKEFRKKDFHKLYGDDNLAQVIINTGIENPKPVQYAVVQYLLAHFFPKSSNPDSASDRFYLA